MNFGYLIVVSTNTTVDYATLAYGLALSIKNTQKQGYDKVALVVDDVTQLDHFTDKWVFDHIIEWNQETFWDGRSWMDTLTPFEHTVCLDADMLFFRDYSHWIDYFVKNSELYVANNAYTYRDELVISDEYRKAFTHNKLPDLYSFWTFFKKDSTLAKEFFTLGRYILKNPVEFSNEFLADYKPKVVGTDEAFALSAKILGIEDEIAYPLEFPKVVHLKPMIQNWPWPADKWMDHVGFYFNRKSQLKIGNFQQDSIVHYVEKDKVDSEIINILEEIAWKKL
jgi:hypothetical protein